MDRPNMNPESTAPGLNQVCEAQQQQAGSPASNPPVVFLPFPISPFSSPAELLSNLNLLSSVLNHQGTQPPLAPAANNASVPPPLALSAAVDLSKSIYNVPRPPIMTNSPAALSFASSMTTPNTCTGNMPELTTIPQPTKLERESTFDKLWAFALSKPATSNIDLGLPADHALNLEPAPIRPIVSSDTVGSTSHANNNEASSSLFRHQPQTPAMSLTANENWSQHADFAHGTHLLYHHRQQSVKDFQEGQQQFHRRRNQVNSISTLTPVCEQQEESSAKLPPLKRSASAEKLLVFNELAAKTLMEIKERTRIEGEKAWAKKVNRRKRSSSASRKVEPQEPKHSASVGQEGDTTEEMDHHPSKRQRTNAEP